MSLDAIRLGLRTPLANVVGAVALSGLGAPVCDNSWGLGFLFGAIGFVVFIFLGVLLLSRFLPEEAEAERRVWRDAFQRWEVARAQWEHERMTARAVEQAARVLAGNDADPNEPDQPSARAVQEALRTFCGMDRTTRRPAGFGMGIDIHRARAIDTFYKVMDTPLAVQSALQALADRKRDLTDDIQYAARRSIEAFYNVEAVQHAARALAGRAPPRDDRRIER